MFLCRYRSSGGGQGCFSVDSGPRVEDRGVCTWIQVLGWRTGVFVDTGPQEEDSGVSTWIQVLRMRIGVFLCRYRS